MNHKHEMEHKYENGEWWFFVEKGDGGWLKDKTWYRVINQDCIDELETERIREQKLKRILDE